jgi:hypothetical protein
MRGRRPQMGRKSALELVGVGVLAMAIVQCARTPACPPGSPADTRKPPQAPSDEEAVASVAAIGVRYERCEKPNEYLLVRTGARELEKPQAQAVQDFVWADIQRRAQSVATGMCHCKTGAGTLAAERCVILRVPDGVAAPPAIANLLRTAVDRSGANDATARLKVILDYGPGPRCAADDPACGPIPYDGARCAEQIGYRPEKPRKAFPSHGVGACTRDGECIAAGCGNDCVSTNEMMLPGSCEYLTALAKRGLCGCVDGACSWFLQDQ